MNCDSKWLMHTPHQKRPWNRFTTLYMIVRAIKIVFQCAKILMILRFVMGQGYTWLFSYWGGLGYISANRLTYTQYRFYLSAAVDSIVSRSC